MPRRARRWSSGSTSGGVRPRSPTTSGSQTSGPAKPATSTAATRWSPRSTARSATLLGLPPAAGEQLQGQRYAPGQEFKPHTDTFEPGGYDFYVHTAAKGQRTWTAMIYLNQPEDGGATRFKIIGKTIQPETGQAAGVEQPAARRPAQPGHAPPGHEGAARDEICADQMVQGAGLGTNGDLSPLASLVRSNSSACPRHACLSPLAFRSVRSNSSACPRHAGVGAGEGIRTLDPNLGKVVLYP